MAAFKICTSSAFKLWPTARSLARVQQFPQLLPPDRSYTYSRRFFSFYCSNSSSRRHVSSQLLSNYSLTSSLSRWFSEKTGETTNTATTKPILGTFQGLGIAGQVQQQQQAETATDGAAGSKSSGGSDEEEEAKRKKEAEASWRAMK